MLFDNKRSCEHTVHRRIVVGGFLKLQKTLYKEGPLYTTVEKCTGRSRVSAQDMVIARKGWYAGEDEKTIFF